MKRLQRHRVAASRDAALNIDRYSLAYFMHPDNDFVVTPLDGSNKYPPVGSHEYVVAKFKKTY
jgi:isopenicillin N synthase-like dioxygenase